MVADALVTVTGYLVIATILLVAITAAGIAAQLIMAKKTNEHALHMLAEEIAADKKARAQERIAEAALRRTARLEDQVAALRALDLELDWNLQLLPALHAIRNWQLFAHVELDAARHHLQGTPAALISAIQNTHLHVHQFNAAAFYANSIDPAYAEVLHGYDVFLAQSAHMVKGAIDTAKPLILRAIDDLECRLTAGQDAESV